MPPAWVMGKIGKTEITVDGHPFDVRTDFSYDVTPGWYDAYRYNTGKTPDFVEFASLPEGAHVEYPNDHLIRFFYRDTTGEHEPVVLSFETQLPFRTVRFDSAGGSSVPDRRVPEHRPVTQLPEPTRDGYYFVGWYIGDIQYNPNQPITGDTVLTAHWVSNKTHAVTFSDGKPFGSTKTVQVHEGQTVEKPADPTRVGYTFDGWYLGDAEYDFSRPVTSDLALTAHWTVGNHVVAFDSNGGRPVAPQVVKTGAKAKAPKNPTRRGYRFAGWYTARRGGALWAFGNPVRANLTLYAHWVRN